MATRRRREEAWLRNQSDDSVSYALEETNGDRPSSAIPYQDNGAYPTQRRKTRYMDRVFCWLEMGFEKGSDSLSSDLFSEIRKFP